MWQVIEPDFRANRSDRSYSLLLESVNVSSLVMEWLVGRMSAMFCGSALTQDLLGQVIISGLVSEGLIKLDYQQGVYEVCGWLDGADPLNYYRHFLE